MQYRRHVVVLLLAAMAVCAAAPASAQATDDQGATQHVARLQNFGTLVAFLNLASGTVRLIAIVEPSSPSSDAAVGALKSILDANPSKRLRAYVVWTRLSGEDSEMRALSRANEFRDRRLVHFWDGEAFVAGSFRSVLGAGETPATDVVMLYDTDARLALAPPAPSLWMSANPKLAGSPLDPAQLGAAANAMVRRVEAKVTDGAAQKP
jgi:hypothetical protein